MKEASTVDFHILSYCSDELKGNVDFLTGILKSTHGWSYAYANTNVKQQFDFIDAALNVNTYLAHEIPSDILNNPTIQSLLLSKNIDMNHVNEEDDLPF
jgi:hypothetical protein